MEFSIRRRPPPLYGTNFHPFFTPLFSLIGLRALNYLDSRILNTNSTFQVGELCGEGEEAARGGGRDRQYSSHFWDVRTYIFSTVGFSVPSPRVWCPFSNYFSKCKELTPSPLTFWMIWSGGAGSAIGRLCKLPIFGIFDLCDITRSESTLKSIKLQYGAEIDGWRAKYEEAQVKIWQFDYLVFIHLQWPRLPIIFCFSHFLFSPSSPSFKMTLAIWRQKIDN